MKRKRQQRALRQSWRREILRLEPDAVTALTNLMSGSFSESRCFVKKHNNTTATIVEEQIHVCQNDPQNTIRGNKLHKSMGGINEYFQRDPNQRFSVHVYGLRRDGVEGLFTIMTFDPVGLVHEVWRAIVSVAHEGEGIEVGRALYKNDQFTAQLFEALRNEETWKEKIIRREPTKDDFEQARACLSRLSKMLKGSLEELPLSDARNMEGAGRQLQHILPCESKFIRDR